jgi:hypothetical protein
MGAKTIELLKKRNKSIIFSYMALRRLIGLLGMLLPFICIAGGLAFADKEVQESISFYYHTNMRDFFVGLMFAVSFFLITYKGYDKIDNIVTTVSGTAGLALAVFPCFFDYAQSIRLGIFQLDQKLSDIFHLSSAAVFFLLLAVNSIFLFTLSSSTYKTPNKRIRNFVYRFCGIVIIACIAALAVLNAVFGPQWLAERSLVLILETVMLNAFGFSWLIKGETLFRDAVEKSS